MHRRCLLALAVTVGCGRFGFDASGGDGGDGGDAPLPAVTLVIPVGGATGVHDAVFGPNGGLAVVGNFAGSMTIGGMTQTTSATSQDVFVAVLDPGGLATWLWTGGVTALGSAQNVAWFADGSLAASGYFAGRLTNGGNLDAGSRQAAALMRFTPSGALAFARHYGGAANIQARGLATTVDQIGLAGLYNSSVDFGAGPLPSTTQDNGFIATMNASAADVSQRALLASADLYVNDIALSPSGDLYAVGRFNATTDFGLGPVAPEAGGSTGFVARYDAQLNLRWVRSFGNASPATSIRLLSNGDCIVAGEVGGTIAIDGIVITSAGDTDGWIARFAAADGAVAWIQTLAGTGYSAIESVAVHKDQIFLAAQFGDTVVLAGSETLVSQGALDAVVAELELDGTLAWSKQLGGTGTVDLGLGGMSVDPKGRHAAIALVYTGELLVEGQSFTAAGDSGAAILVAIPPD